MRHKRNGYLLAFCLKNRLKVLAFTPNSRAVPLTPFALTLDSKASRLSFARLDLLTLVLAPIPWALMALATISFEQFRASPISRMDFPSSA